jgi:hypothetical protein
MEDPFKLKSIILDPGLPEDVQKQAIRWQAIYSTIGLVVGLICVLGGVALFLHGIGGKSSWVFEAFGMKSNLTDAAPGAVLFVTGAIIVALTRYVVDIRKRD